MESQKGKGVMIDQHLVREVVKGALVRRRQVIVYELARRILEAVSSSSLPQTAMDVVTDDEWTKIESLSQLRATVGGRFQNLKSRWTRAGFPLREHRGDRGGKATIDEDGWLELSMWINKQGFEVRRSGESDPWLFAVKASREDDGS